MITYINRTFDNEVEAKISVYASSFNKFPEVHVMFNGINMLLPYAQQLENIINAYKTFLFDNQIYTPVFSRYFLSDAANQTRALKTKLDEVPQTAVSIVQQPPVDGTKIAMWVYLVGSSAKVSVSDGFLTVTHNSYQHYWTAGRKSTHGNSEIQTKELLEQYEQDLKDRGCMIEDNCLRTWFFVQNVDVNYGGLVKARRENFEANDLTEYTHYIASTGIEGRDEDPNVHVLFDAYAINGIEPEQIDYLYADSHLCPTHFYGVTFERGVSIIYGDRTHLYISGTASINNKGKVLYPGNVVKQAIRVCRNVEKLLEEREAALDDIVQMIVYLRDASDYPLVKPLINERIPEVPVQFVQAPVCRPAWLIEIECIAVIHIGHVDFDVF